MTVQGSGSEWAREVQEDCERGKSLLEVGGHEVEVR